MADQNDAEKTEEPTAKKLSDARKKGNVARSQEVNSWATLLGLLVALVFVRRLNVPDVLRTGE